MKRMIASLVLVLFLLAGCGASRQAPSPEPDPPPPAALEPGPTPPPAKEPTPPAPVKEGPAWVDLAIRVGDGPWEKPRSGATYPRERLTLRFDLHGPVDEAALRERLPQGAKVAKVGDDRLEAVWEKAPPVLEFFGVGEPPGQVIRFYTGKPARLLALDPATGQERSLGELPADIQEAHLAPDGAAALVIYMDAPGQFRTHYVDLKSGAQQETLLGHQWRYGLVTWYGGRVVKTVKGQIQFWDPQSGELESVGTGARLWGALSPDGRYLAGLDYKAVTAGSVTPITLFIFDLKERKEQHFPEATRIWVGSHHVDQHMEWTADSQALLMLDYLERQQTRTLRLDLATGEINPVDVALAAPSYGRWIAGPGGWSYRDAPWETLRVKGSDGEEREWEPGYPVGWSPSGELLLIRWENVTHRIIWGI